MLSSPASRSRKSDNTCAQCRARKVRCDGQRSGCSHCQRLGFTCSFQGPVPPPDGQATDWTKPPGRCRARRACVGCRVQKVRCSAELPACRRCARRGEKCVYAASGAPDELTLGPPRDRRDTRGSDVFQADAIDEGAAAHTSVSRPPDWLPPVPSESLPLPPPEIVRKALEYFFQNIYPLPRVSFLHQSSLQLAVGRRDADPSLVFALCGICSIYLWSKGSDGSDGSEWISAAEEIILRDLDHPSISRIQALLLVIQHRLESRCFSKAFMLITLAARAAFGFRLNYEHSKLPFKEQEIRRRVMWAVWATEKLWSGGLTEFELCQDRVMNIQLPCREEEFERGNAVVTEHLQRPQDSRVPSNHGLLGHCLRLIGMRNTILINNKKLLTQKCEPSTALESVKDLEDELRRMKATLGSAAEFSLENLRQYADARCLARYIMVHTSWHQCNCDNYRVFLTGYPRAVSSKVIELVDPAFVAYAQRKCLEHAHAMIEIFTALLGFEGDLPVMDTDLAMCAFHSARVIHYIHWRNQRKSPQETDKVFKKLQVCVELVTRAFPNSPVTSVYLQDMQYLATHPLSKDASSSRPQSPELESCGARKSVNPVPEAKSKQLLERHSLIRLANFVNDSPLPSEEVVPNDRLLPRRLSANPVADPREMPIVRMEPLGLLLGNSAATTPTEPRGMVDESLPDLFPIMAPGDLGQWEGALQAPWDHLDFLINPEVYTQQESFGYFGTPGFA